MTKKELTLLLRQQDISEKRINEINTTLWNEDAENVNCFINPYFRNLKVEYATNCGMTKKEILV